MENNTLHKIWSLNNKAQLNLKVSWALLLSIAMLITISVAAAQPYSQAPMLDQSVEAGTLPPVEDRLPETPLIVQPFERIGTYGGTLRTDLTGGVDRGRGWIRRIIGYEGLVRWDPEWTEVLPNVAESWEVSEDASEFTFHLRQGLKWSDGEPFTADDIMFWYEDVLLNQELFPGGVESWLVIGGEPVAVEKMDDYTVLFRFAAPYGQFLQQLATGWNYTFLIPRHYAEQFHPRYNEEGVDALVRQENLDSWITLFAEKIGLDEGDPALGGNPERPTLNAWLINTPYDGSSAQVTAERNPYYWKIDPEGNQLPYIDSVVFPVFGDDEVLKLQILNGDLDFVYRPQVLGIADKGVFFDNQERGDYRFIEQVSDVSTAQVIHLNLTHQNPVLRDIFNNKDFRIGLSYAINRPELIDVIYVAQGEPYQVSPRPESPLYDEAFSKQYTEYDPELANEHFDKAGYTERSPQGIRLGPDGKPISFSVQVRSTNQEQIDGLELIKNYWREVGIDMQVNVIESSLYAERLASNQHDAVSNVGAGGLGEMLNARLYVPINENALYAIPWANWYNSGTPSEEPPVEVQEQLELYSQLQATADPAEQDRLMREIFAIAKDEFYHIGINLITGRYAIAKNSLRNIQEPMPDSFTYPTPAPTNLSTWFFADE